MFLWGLQRMVWTRENNWWAPVLWARIPSFSKPFTGYFRMGHPPCHLAPVIRSWCLRRGSSSPDSTVSRSRASRSSGILFEHEIDNLYVHSDKSAATVRRHRVIMDQNLWRMSLAHCLLSGKWLCPPASRLCVQSQWVGHSSLPSLPAGLDWWVNQ